MRSLPQILVACALAAGLAVGQSPKGAALSPAFDAASLKRVDTPFDPRLGLGMKGGPGTDDPGRFTDNRVYLPALITTAWNVEEYQVSGPAWLKSGPDQLYAITATMPPNTTKDQFHLMLQNLLIERFHMRVHRETRTLSGYELVVAPGGAKLKETAQDLNGPPGRITGVAPDGFPLMSPGRGGMSAMSKDGVHFKAQAYTIEEFLHSLRGFIRQTVETDFGPLADKTGLTGRYDFTLQFDGSNAPAPVTGRNVAMPANGGPDSVTDPSGSPPLLTALEKQLGLKLVKVRKVPVDMLVVDYMDKVPTPN